MPENTQGIRVKWLAIGSIVCIVVGLAFGVMAAFEEEPATYGVLGLSLICIGIVMLALSLIKKQAQTPGPSDGNPGKGKS